MPGLRPVYANLIILFGQEACERFHTMLEYWKDILDISTFGQFVFLLVGNGHAGPSVPNELKELVVHNCWSLDMDALDETERLPEIEEALHGCLTGGHVLVQCVCSDFATRKASADAPLRLAKMVSEGFAMDVVQCFQYLLLKKDAGTIAAQRLLLEALHEETGLARYTYLLSEEADDDSSVSASSIWRTVFYEMLINSAGQRTLPRESVFSLGFATLNADNGELQKLRRHKLLQRLTERINTPIEDKRAWSILSGARDGGQGAGAAQMAENVQRWLDWIVSNRLDLPGKQERRNNRILSGLYDVSDIGQCVRAVNRFYRINFGNEAKMEEEAKAFSDGYLVKVKENLSKHIETASFPQHFLQSVTHALSDVQKRQPPTQNAELPKKRLFMTKRAYVDLCCAKAERQEEDNLRLTYRRLYAKAIAEALQKLNGFLTAAKGAGGLLLEQAQAPAEISELMQKYPKYWSQVNEVDHSRHEDIFAPEWFAQRAPFFSPEGVPVARAWRLVIQDGERRIHERMPTGFNGTFCETISNEYDHEEALSAFFDRYLTKIKRMLYSVHDEISPPQRLFFTDTALARHPWLQRYSQNSILSKNDNVECVDLYTIRRSTKEILLDADSRYFTERTMPPRSGGRLVPVWGDAKEEEGGGDEGILREPEIPLAPQEAKSVPENRNLRLLHVENRYILLWDWVGGEKNAVVQIWQDGVVKRTYPCSVEQFNARIGNCPYGVDVTHDLPAGKINVRVVSGERFSVEQQMAGRKNDVSYLIVAQHKKGCTLLIKGAPADVDKLFLRVKNDKGRALLYPILPSARKTSGQEIRFENLALGASQSELVTHPDDLYPTVRVIRNERKQ